MRPLLYPTYLGRSWAVRNDSCRPDDEVLSLLGFVLDRTGGLGATGAVHVKDAGARSRGHYSGVGGSRLRGHAIPRWVSARTRYYMRLTIPLDDWEGYGCPRVCWHSTGLRKLDEEVGPEELFVRLAAMYEAGETRFGRWPLYVANDWRELFVHLAAHEAGHLIQFDRDRGLSEIFCETFARDTLDEYRSSGLARAVTSPSPVVVAGKVNDDHGDRGSFTVLGLVTGPATADPPTNRKEQSMTAATPTASDEVNPDPKPASKPKATATTTASSVDTKDLFASLLSEATKVADKTAKVEKAAYVRVDVLLDDGKKHKTLAYLNNPTSKSVRVEIPKKGGGGYDVVKVTKHAEIEKALKAIRANHDRIVAAQAAA